MRKKQILIAAMLLAGCHTDEYDLSNMKHPIHVIGKTEASCDNMATITFIDSIGRVKTFSDINGIGRDLHHFNIGDTIK